MVNYNTNIALEVLHRMTTVYEYNLDALHKISEMLDISIMLDTSVVSTAREFLEPFQPADYYKLFSNRMLGNLYALSILKHSYLSLYHPPGCILEAEFHPSATTHTLVDLLTKVIARPDLPFYHYSEERTSLHWAVDRGHLNVVEVLVYSSADVNAQVTTVDRPSESFLFFLQGVGKSMLWAGRRNERCAVVAKEFFLDMQNGIMNQHHTKL